MKHFFLWLSLIAGAAAWAQGSCASDGQPMPLALTERFISADCAPCWSAPSPSPAAAGALTIDWIVPSARGDEAPLSAAASRDAWLRLETLGRAAPATSFSTRTQVKGDPGGTLRVAHGVALGGYIGASIELKTSGQARQHQTLSAWLVLVETIAAGADGTASERNLVRNVLLSSWSAPEPASTTAPASYRETRPLSIPPGATAARLRVVGWLQDAHGRVLSAAQSVCAPPG